MFPLTSETSPCSTRGASRLLPDGALVVNAGRGRTSTPAPSSRSSSAGRLRAALDVTDPEPLPPDHPLWALPNALITPHIAGDSPRPRPASTRWPATRYAGSRRASR